MARAVLEVIGEAVVADVGGHVHNVRDPMTPRFETDGQSRGYNGSFSNLRLKSVTFPLRPIASAPLRACARPCPRVQARARMRARLPVRGSVRAWMHGAPTMLVLGVRAQVCTRPEEVAPGQSASWACLVPHPCCTVPQSLDPHEHRLAETRLAKNNSNYLDIG